MLETIEMDNSGKAEEEVKIGVPKQRISSATSRLSTINAPTNELELEDD